MDAGALLLAASVPAACGLAVGWMLWRRQGQEDSGILAGIAVVMLLVIVFILREFYGVMRALARCREAGIPCEFDPEPAMRYAIVAGLGMAEILAVFLIGLFVTARQHRRRAG